VSRTRRTRPQSTTSPFTDLNDPSLVVAAGSFMTDGAAVDPGYKLLVSMMFDYVTMESGRPIRCRLRY
jgi:hypothetical protein